MRFQTLVSSLIVTGMLLTYTESSHAAARLVKPGQIKNVTVTIKNRSYKVACNGTTPGATTVQKTTTRARKKGTYFLSFRDESKSLARVKTKKAKARVALLKSLIASGTQACKATNPPGGIAPTPTPTPVPPRADQFLLDRYQGGFGVAEAQLLFNRFGFGGTPNDIQQAVSVGLEATVDRLLTFVNEPGIDALVDDITCDDWLGSDPLAGSGNRACNPSNVNDFSRAGLHNGMLLRYALSSNQLFHRIAFFLMDERLSVSHLAARDCERHAIKTYLNSVNRAAQSGDYIRYMRDMNNDQLMHLRSLDGATNRGGLGFLPNENYAREFWELGTVGPAALDGTPVYTDLDVAQAALAFTGWNIDEVSIGGNTVCLASYVPLFHSPGPKTIFIGTPYQATVDNAEDVLQATMQHPRTSEHLAEDIWKEFINPFATPTEIQELAQIIRENGYNLLPVFRRIMLSKAVFAPASRNSLIKHPIDVVLGFIRATGFPLYYRQYDDVLNRIEQQILNPSTVFGWNVKYLSGEQLQIEWWNVFIDYFINVDMRNTKRDYGWTYYDRFVADLHAAGLRTSGDVIDRVARDLGIAINASQKAELDQMMNYYLSTYNCPGQCNGAPYRLIRNRYDTDPTATESGNDWSGQRRLRLMIAALMELPEARTK